MSTDRNWIRHTIDQTRQELGQLPDWAKRESAYREFRPEKAGRPGVMVRSKESPKRKK